MTTSFTIRSLQAFCYRYPLATPVVTSFGTMRDRPAVFVRVEDTDGVVGWGEVWCNFPSVGAEHRTRIVNEMLAPMLQGRAVTEPAAIFNDLSLRLAVMALQSGEAGPFAQAIAGIDIALWDLHAKRQALPLWRLLGGQSPRLRVYASGINPVGSAEMAEAAMQRGHRAFKLKIGFDPATDLENLRDVRAVVGNDPLAVDANQAWSLPQAQAVMPGLAEFDLAWLEEPLRCDRDWREWRALREHTAIPFAAGENIASRDGFRAAITENILAVIQPDVAKWGGVTACHEVALAVVGTGHVYCPHYLGGGIGLLASAHLLAATGGAGMLEIDSNPNPLRDDLCGACAATTDGEIELTDAPGLGIDIDLAAIEPYRTL